MDAEAVADILHLFFEEDFVASAAASPEAATRKDAIRKAMYEKVYDRPYRIWMGQDSQRIPETAHGDDDDNDLLDDELDRLAEQQVTVQKKAFIPPTPVNPESSRPYGSIVEAPMN